MKSVVVTGGSGKAGRAVIRDLVEHGYRVMNVDLVAPREPLCHFLKADLTDLGAAIDGSAAPPAPSTVAARHSATPTPSSISPGFRHPASRPMRRSSTTT